MTEFAQPPADYGVLHRRIVDHVRGMYERSDGDADRVASDLVESAVADIPGAQYAGITVIKKRRRVHTEAATHDFPEVLDRIQQRHQQGPCLTNQWEQHMVRIPDLAAETRWPAYCRDALSATPIRSSLSFELFNGDEMLSALNIFAEDVDAFTDATEDIGMVFAAHAALAWSSVRKDHQFASALASRDIIGQAKGIIMERYQINAVYAFHILRKLSQESNIPLAQIAQRLVVADFDPGS